MSPAVLKFILAVAATTAGLFLATQLFPGVTSTSTGAIVAAGVVLGILNAWVRPIVKFLAFPVNVLTLGFATFFINILMVALAVLLVPGVVIASFWAAAGTVLLVSFLTTLVRVLTFRHSLSPL